MSLVPPRSLPLACSDPRGSGIPVLFVHGFSHNRSVWEKLGRTLPEAFRPIAVDLRGHGESPWSIEGEYDLRCYAADLPALLDRLGVERAVVVGHSLGGNVATLFAAAYPERILSLVLVDTGPALEASGTSQVVDDVESALRSFGRVAGFRQQLGQIHPKGDPEILDRLAATSLVERIDGRYEPALDPGVLGLGSEGTDLVALERELWESLGRVSAPVLVVRGGVSAILSEKVAREMVDEVLPDGRLVTIPEAGHAVMIDQGAELAAAICGFVAARSGSGDSKA